MVSREDIQATCDDIVPNGVKISTQLIRKADSENGNYRKNSKHPCS